MVSANPAGQHRRLMRHTLKQWLDAQAIAGIGHIYPGMAPALPFESDPDSQPDFACLIRIAIPDSSEDRDAYTGPIDPGGKTIHYQVVLHVYHRTFHLDGWEAGEDDYDRIIDAIKDSIRGRGRDLGRPDVVFSVGEYPRVGGISDEHDEPVEASGVFDRWGRISFQVTQYLPTFVP